jgi:uncharacterized membrane protein
LQVEKCGICGKLAAALQTCRLCKRRVCEEHFKQQEGICSQCHSRLSLATRGTEETSLSAIPFKLFLLGFLLTFAGVIVLMIAALTGGGESSVSTGVVIIVGFIPIVIGSGPYAFYAILIAVVLTIISFAVFVWMRRQASKS